MTADEIERDIFLSYPPHHPLRQWVVTSEEQRLDELYVALEEARAKAYEEGKEDAENADGLLDKIKYAEQRASEAERKLSKYRALAETVRWVSKGKLTKAEMVSRLQTAYAELNK